MARSAGTIEDGFLTNNRKYDFREQQGGSRAAEVPNEAGPLPRMTAIRPHGASKERPKLPAVQHAIPVNARANPGDPRAPRPCHALRGSGLGGRKKLAGLVLVDLVLGTA